MSCRQELSLYPKRGQDKHTKSINIQNGIMELIMLMLTRCTRKPPSVATESGSAVCVGVFDVAPDERPGPGVDLDADVGTRVCVREVTFGLGGDGGAREAAPDF
jgi:hypothetical protein